MTELIFAFLAIVLFIGLWLQHSCLPSCNANQKGRRPKPDVGSPTARRWPIKHAALVGGVSNADRETALDAANVRRCDRKSVFANRRGFFR